MAQEFLSQMPEKQAPDLSKMVVSPMPGLVKAVSCAVGDVVAEGQELCVIGETAGAWCCLTVIIACTFIDALHYYWYLAYEWLPLNILNQFMPGILQLAIRLLLACMG